MHVHVGKTYKCTHNTCTLYMYTCTCVYMYIHFFYSLIGMKYYIFLCQGVGGTVHLPRGFLKKAYDIARESGGLCISDEVSVHVH